ncbi:MAG: type II 3-dehydroquinate dehydratase [Bacteroidales bacterium]|jgi:3-dehydroquinate dehydratase-2|nr:3-dehydroquinate dehydratase [Bacteroidales bacterium]OQA92801.1 MAG: 3-dehydroquinate dehydratase [Bacteroidetes bacterium ADurb.Bin234]MDD3331444.1 3-dehydroquinate dehydratase [Bacteroidales bacterium]MDD3692238.1 3-dehydroquinate dehydratase [Bacteroidales bacterium]MDD4045492.1 3-dehydroquinate dehydratase [Bacteroidales bacterium]
MRLLLLNGPNLNLLGQRETAIYGGIPFDIYLEKLRSKYPSITIDYQQCNIEGALVEAIQNAQLIYDGIILNAGAYTHTSIAIADAIRAIDIPVVEVHISNLMQREAFRRHSFLTSVCKGSIAGFGLDGYTLAVESFLGK